MDGIDLTGKLAVVTGGYSGIGLETTRALVGAGATVVVPARRPDVAREALAGTDRVEVAQLDLADLDSVRIFTDEFLASGRRIDLLFNNAAIMANPETRVGPGWESQFATNHLGHFALVSHLWPALADGARVIVTSSRAHAIHGINWDDIHFTKNYERWNAYGQAKTANVLFAVELDRRGASRGIRALAVHPGIIKTPLQRHFPAEEQIALGWMDAQGNPNPDFKSVAQGAATQLWAATSPALAGVGGVYCVDCDIAPVDGVAEWAIDPGQAQRLWSLSAELTGVDVIAAP
jgi:NAD(P)-dependent dehydrogenase (short-subunit alcohol dehydrogenase family)